MPTMTRLPAMVPRRASWCTARERVAPAREVVVHAAHHQRRAVARGLAPDLLGRQPRRAHDAVVERAAGVVRGDLACEREADVGHVVARVVVLVDTEQRGRFERVGRLLQRLARDGVEQRFARLEVAGGLVEAAAVLGVFLDQQEAAVALDHGGDGDVGFPDHEAQF